jgi:AraC family transcriptional regulator
MNRCGFEVEAAVATPWAQACIVWVKAPACAHRVVPRSLAGVVNMCLTPRPPNAQASFSPCGPGPFHPLGEIYFKPPNTQMWVRSDAGVQRTLLLEVNAPELACIDPSDQRRLLGGLDLRLPSIRRSCRRLAYELSNPDFATNPMVDSLARVISLDILRFYRARGAEGSSRRRGGLSSARLLRLDERIASDDQPSPTLAELARLCGLSQRHLMRAFLESRGETLGEYVSRARIERAKRLLGGEAPVASVGLSVGFATPSSFSAAFQAAVGCSPSRYRRMLWDHQRPA